jgi:hypothetical protein
MTLPEICPLDENQMCKGWECHLFCLEWRTKEPTCLIGYSTTRKTSEKSERNKDTYAEETFRKLGRDPISKRKSVSEKGDWIPSRLVKNAPMKPVERKNEKRTHNWPFQEETVRKPDPKLEENYEEKIKERSNAVDPEKAPISMEYRLEEVPEKNQSVCTKMQSRVKERPIVQEKIILNDKHTTIFVASDADKKDNSYRSGRDENTKKLSEIREKRKKLDEVMKIDLQDTQDEDFWS